MLKKVYFEDQQVVEYWKNDGNEWIQVCVDFGDEFFHTSKKGHSYIQIKCSDDSFITRKYGMILI